MRHRESRSSSSGWMLKVEWQTGNAPEGIREEISNKSDEKEEEKIIQTTFDPFTNSQTLPPLACVDRCPWRCLF